MKFLALAKTKKDFWVFTFGWNKNGQLGLGHNEDQTLPIKLDFPSAGGVVTAIACLFFSSVALLDSGEHFINRCSSSVKIIIIFILL
ncbi:Hypothetical predicted protein [Cloeon dipterum]|uniref:Uncharacterized protein n=1 Tax=Cloeon dipterum TaxID=197152 RepID=A0A8S1DZA4_9INSE|nr:Hypothetical predicted protein [Cloeon dipterum]